MKRIAGLVLACSMLAGGCSLEAANSHYEAVRGRAATRLTGRTIVKAVLPNAEDVLLILDNGETVTFSDPGGVMNVKFIGGEQEAGCE